MTRKHEDKNDKDFIKKGSVWNLFFILLNTAGIHISV